MNATLQRNHFNAVPAYYYSNPAKNNTQNIKNQNSVTDNHYDISIYKSKGLTLPFGGGKSTVVYAGSFDPITKGHLDIIKAAAKRFKKVIVLVANNPKKIGFIPIDKRVELIKKSIKGLDNVHVDIYDGLTINYAKLHGAKTLIRGLRTVSDFESEMQMSEINRQLNPKIRTLFISSDSKYSAISSSAVREILSNKGNISKFVPRPVAKYLAKYQQGK